MRLYNKKKNYGIFPDKKTSSDQFSKVSAARPNAFSAMYKEGQPGDKIEEGKQLGCSIF